MAEENEKASEDLVEKAKADRVKARGPIAQGVLFMRQVVQELSKVTRPTRKELISHTGTVLAFVAVVMVIISAFDWLFSNAVKFVFAG